MDVIIPLSAMNPASVEERLKSLRYGIDKFYLPQGCMVILVEQSVDGKIHFLESVPSHKNIKKIALEFPVFNKQWCTNVGVMAGRSEIFCVAESDMLGTEMFFGSVAEFMRRGGLTWCIGWNRIYYANEAEKAELLSGRRVVVHDRKRTHQPVRGLKEGGFNFWDRTAWFNMGQANEFFQGLGGPDNELAFRGSYLNNGKYPCFPAFVYHLWHPQVSKNTPHRKVNKALLSVTKRNPARVNMWLRKHPGGDNRKPLCARAAWGVE